MAPKFLNLRSHADSDPIRNFRFLVKFTAYDQEGRDIKGGYTQSLHLGFMTVQGLAAQTESIPYREGGFNTTSHQLPGQQAFSPVTLQKGVVLGDAGGWEWFRTLYDPGMGRVEDNEIPTKNFRYQVDIDVLKYPSPGNRNITQESTVATREGALIATRFVLINAWPTNIAYSDLNASDNAVLVEQLTLVHEGLAHVKNKDVGYSGLGGEGQYTGGTTAN